jgi:hypothetical protein
MGILIVVIIIGFLTGHWLASIGFGILITLLDIAGRHDY